MLDRRFGKVLGHWMILDCPSTLLHECSRKAKAIQSFRTNFDAACRENFPVPILCVGHHLLAIQESVLHGSFGFQNGGDLLLKGNDLRIVGSGTTSINSLISTAAIFESTLSMMAHDEQGKRQAREHGRLNQLGPNLLRLFFCPCTT